MHTAQRKLVEEYIKYGIKIGKMAKYTIPFFCILNITLYVMKIDVYEGLYTYLFWVFGLCMGLLINYLFIYVSCKYDQNFKFSNSQHG